VPIPCHHEDGGPTCSRFSPGWLTTHLSRLGQAENPSSPRTARSSTRPDDESSNHPDETSHRSDATGVTPQRASESRVVASRHHQCAVSHETQQLQLHHVRCFLPEVDPRPPRRVSKDLRSPRASTQVKKQKARRTIDGDALEQIRARNLLSPASSSYGITPPVPTEMDDRQDFGATKVTLHPCTRVTIPPTPKCWANYVFNSGSRRGPIENRRRRHTRDESSTSPPLTNLSRGHEIASPGTHRGGGQSRTRGNRGHPLPLREGRDPSNTDVSGGLRSSPDHEETHRRIDDRDPSRSSDRVDHSLCCPRPTPAAGLASHERAVGRCDDGKKPGFRAASVTHPAAWPKTRGLRAAASQWTQSS
jgi:hypothetical protein